MSRMMQKNPQPISVRRATSGFSMVELLVVLGIVALATAVLVPAVQTVRRTAATTQCADNLRTLGLALTGYLNEAGTYPYGQYTVAANSQSIQALWDTGDPNTGVYVWWSVLRGYVAGNGAAQHNGTARDELVPRSRMNDLLNCPIAIDRTNGVDYVPNAAVMTQRDLELGLNGHPLNKQRVNRPATATGVYSDTALLWDTPELTSTENPLVRKRQYVISYRIDAAPGSGKDNLTQLGLLASPKKPSWRYRNVSNTNRTIDPKNYADYTPIYPGINQDIDELNTSETAGGIRFRHGQNDAANFLFADGSVRTHDITRNWNSPTPTGTLLRKYFRSKLPSGFSGVDAPG